MKAMTGEIGKLSLNGEQVGGFKYWTAIIKLNPLHSRVIASKFWMLKKVDTNKLKAEFYTEINGKLKLIREGEVTVNLPEYELDKMITQPIELDIGDFDWRN